MSRPDLASLFRPHPRITLADIVLFVLVATLQSRLTLGHAPWFDELQALVLARDSGALAQWWENFRHEGHPPLWHLVLKASLFFFDDPRALAAAQVLIATATQALLVFAAPFALAVRAIISVGYFILFEYGALARAYGLGVMLMLVATALRGRLLGHLALILLPLVAAQFAVLALLLAGLLRIERRLSWPVITLVALACVAAYLFARPPADFTHADARHASLAIRALATLAQSSGALAPIDPSLAPQIWETRVQNGGLALALGAATPLVAIFAFRLAPLPAAALGLFWLATCLISIFVALMTNRHFGLLVALLIVLEWLRVESGRAISRVSVAWFALHAALGLFAAYHALRLPFAPGPEVARLLREPRFAGVSLIATPPLVGIDLVARNNARVVNLAKGCADTFQIWNYYRYRALEPAETLARIRRVAALSGGRAILVIQKEEAEKLGDLSAAGLVLIARFEAAMFYQALVYEVFAPSEGRTLILPDCLAATPADADRLR